MEQDQINDQRDTSQEGLNKRGVAYCKEYLAFRHKLGQEGAPTGEEISTLYAIYRKDLREGDYYKGRRGTPQKKEENNENDNSNNGKPATPKQKSWLKDLVKKGELRKSFDEIENLSSWEASKLLDKFTK